MAYGDNDGNLCIRCASETANVEMILLRCVLGITGHQITKTRDVWLNATGKPCEHCDTEFATDYPWKLYKETF